VSANPAERETVITTSDADRVVSIWTAQAKFIRALRKEKAAREVRTGMFEGSEFAVFEVNTAQWNPVRGFKRTRTMSPEAKAAAAERLRKARA
jgi:hypothetical protein